MARGVMRRAVYLWAGPTTLVGLCAGALTLGTGGRVGRRRGVLECHGGFARWLRKQPGKARKLFYRRNFLRASIFARKRKTNTSRSRNRRKITQHLRR